MSAKFCKSCRFLIHLAILAGLLVLSTGTGCPAASDSPTVNGDVNGDGVINEADMDAVTAAFGLSQGDPGFNAAADLNGDGTVGLADLQLMGQILDEQTRANGG